MLELSSTMKQPDSESERRSISDRRAAPTSMWNSIFFGGRRRYVRRASERQQVHYVDHFPWLTLVWVLLLVAFTFIDGLLTLELLDAGCIEANPIMSKVLDHGPGHFFMVKYLLTTLGLPLLVFLSVRSWFKYLLPGFVLLYVILMIYQLNLLHQLSAGS
jgi:hypothetical protein